MTDQAKANNGGLVPTAGRNLAPVAAGNPLVSRGIADLALHRSAKVIALPLADPRRALDYYNHGMAWLDECEFDKAIQEFNEAIRLHPNNALFYNTRGLARLCRNPRNGPSYADNPCTLFLCEEDFDEAVRDFEEAIRLDAQNALFYNSRGIAWMDKGHLTGHFAWIDKAHHDQAYNHFAKAIKDFDEAIRLDHKSAPIYFNRGLAWKEFDDAVPESWDNKVIVDIEHAKRLDPREKAIKDLDEAIRLDPYCAAAYHNRGKLERNGDKRIKNFDEAIRLDPTNAFYYSDRGNEWSHKKDYDRAIKDFDNAIRLAPRNAGLYRDRGNVWSWKKDYDRAIMDFDEAIRLAPERPDYYRDRGRAWLLEGDEVKAIQDYDDYVRLAPNKKFAYRNRAEFWRMKKNYDKVIMDCNEVIRLDPDDGYSYYCRAEAWSCKKNYNNAIEDYEQAIRASPTFECPYLDLAELLATCPEAKVRNCKRAIQIATEACELRSWESGSALGALAAAYAEDGQFAEAEHFQTKALRFIGELRRDDFRERLELYKQKKPFRQST